MTDSFQLDFSAADVIADPYPGYRHLQLHDPVHRSASGFWYLTRHADVSRAFTDTRLRRQSPFGANPFTDQSTAESSAEAFIDRWLVFLDPPDHTRLRKLLQRHFTPKLFNALRPRIEEFATQLIDAGILRGRMDVIDDFAYPLPVRVIAALLGVPDTDLSLFRGWAEVLTQAVDDGAADKLAAAIPVVRTMADYFEDLLRRPRPLDGLLGMFADAEARAALSHGDVVGTCIFLLWAGHETTKILIGNGLYLLLEHPQQQAALRRNPGLIVSAVEEFLRYESPVQKISRWTIEPCEFSGITIPADQLVVNLLGAANRDPLLFRDPDRFDIERTPNRHITFGKGIHHCLGALLARTEAQIAINTVLQRCATVEPLIDKVEWRPLTSLRSFNSLPVALRAS